jgi:hypothetical protein
MEKQMIEVLHVDDAYRNSPTSFHEMRSALKRWDVELIPESSFSESAIDTFLNAGDSTRTILLDLQDDPEGLGRGGQVMEKFSQLASIVLFTKHDTVWPRIKDAYGDRVSYVPKPILGTTEETEETAKSILKKLPKAIRGEIRSKFADDFVDEQLGKDF